MPVVTRPSRPLRQRLRLPLMLAGPIVVLLAATWWYLTSGRYVSTDDAYVQAARTMVSADISGRVVAVAVHDNERVTRRPDAVPARRPAVPDRGRGGQGDARRGAAAGRGAEGDLPPEARRCEGGGGNARLSAARVRPATPAAATGVAPRSTFDQVQNAMQVARQKVASTQSELANMLAQLGGNPDLPLDRHPSVQRAQAALDKAEFDLTCTMVRAPRTASSPKSTSCRSAPTSPRRRRSSRWSRSASGSRRTSRRPS